MSSGIIHDRVGVCVGLAIVSLPLIQYAQLPPANGAFTSLQTAQIVIGVSEVLGTLYLSPDLDGKGWRSECLKRWDALLLGWVWAVYGNAIPHRHPLSHSPIVGTSLRIAYLSFFLAILIFMLPWITLTDFYQLMQSQWQVFGSILIGLELSANVHYYLDGLWTRWLKSALGIKSKSASRRRKYRKVRNGY